jgi:hypothetical protein
VTATQRLYYTTTLDTIERFILPQLRIRLSTFDAVNDPFELLALRRGGRSERRRFDWLYDYWVQLLGFVSLSETWQSPLMWAHYGDNHTGVCLGFDVPLGRALKVSYEPERLRLLFDATKLETAHDTDLIRTLVTTKFTDWSYEREWRILERLGSPDEETGFHFLEFSPDFELREIILGASCCRRPSEIRAQVFGNTAKVVVRKVRAGFNSFEMVRQQRVPELTITPLHRIRRRG